MVNILNFKQFERSRRLVGNIQQDRLDSLISVESIKEFGEPVLIVGAGLHQYLDSPEPLKNWNFLLDKVFDEVCREKSLQITSSSLAWPRNEAMRWESMIKGIRTELLSANPKPRAHDVEELLQSAINRLIRDAEKALAKQASFNRFSEGLKKTKLREIVTLNFDQTLETALAGNERGPQSNEHNTATTKSPARHSKVDGRRIWHPHGMVGPNKMYRSISLGYHRYCRDLSDVRDDIATFRRASREGSGENPPSLSTWPRLFLRRNNLIFIGCSLREVEIDLWYALHCRQRELLRRKKKPATLIIRKRGDEFPYGEAWPAGLTPVVVDDFSEAWDRLLA